MKQLLKIIHLLRRFYWRIIRPETRGVRAILLDPNGKIILVWHKYQEGWFLPGGKISRKESAGGALRRELKEELGVEFISHFEQFGEYINTYEYKKDTITVFIASGFEQKPKNISRLKKNRVLISKTCRIQFLREPNDASKNGWERGQKRINGNRKEEFE